jgi:hypothetical protein
MSALARVGRLARLEAWKASRSLLVRVAVLAVAAVAAATALLHEPLAVESGWRAAALSLVNARWAAEIFLLVLGATAIAGEAAQGTLKMVLPHAYRRGDWVAAKMLALAFLAVVLAAVAAGVSLAAGALGRGLTDVVQEIAPEFGMTDEPTFRVLHESGDMARRFGASALAVFGSLVASAALGLLMSCLFPALVPALLAAFLLFFALATGGVLFGASREVLANVYAWFPGEMLTLLEKLGRALNEDWNAALLSRALLLSGATALGSVLVSLAVFGRRDLH